VTTKNEEKNIGGCLRSIKEQTHEDVEIIVVDNHSSDNTVKIARQFTDKIYSIGPERSTQRNFGAKNAEGKYILYLDADMILSKKLIEECVEKCESESCIALYIPERIVGDGFWIKVRNFERSFYNATCIDAVRFIARNKFLEVGGFDTSLTGPEDWDFDRRIGGIGKADIINAPLYHKEGTFNFHRYLDKKAYYSKSFDKYAGKWGKDDPVVRKQLVARYRLFEILVKNNKWKKLLRHPALTIGMCYLKLRVWMRIQGSKK